MRRKSFKDDLCPAARSLDSIGEWWSLLIVRNALFGMSRFKKGRDLLPVIVALRQWGENYLFSRREKRLQIVDKRTLKPPRRLAVQNVKGDALAPNDLELVTVTTRLAV